LLGRPYHPHGHFLSYNVTCSTYYLNSNLRFDQVR
jgi:hypothetical protein